MPYAAPASSASARRFQTIWSWFCSARGFHTVWFRTCLCWGLWSCLFLFASRNRQIVIACFCWGLWRVNPAICGFHTPACFCWGLCLRLPHCHLLSCLRLLLRHQVQLHLCQRSAHRLVQLYLCQRSTRLPIYVLHCLRVHIQPPNHTNTGDPQNCFFTVVDSVFPSCFHALSNKAASLSYPRVC